MSSNVPKSTPAVDEAINTAVTHEQLREQLLSAMVADGNLIRSRDSEFNNRLVIRQPEPNVSVPANFKFEREIHFAQSTGKRSLVIRANSQTDLDALEKQVTGQ